LIRHSESFEEDNKDTRKYQRESVQLSASGIFPLILEQADKFLISYFFGLETLGLYVIGVSTGRILLHFIKPTLTIYFPYLVQYRLSLKLMIFGFLAFSSIGAISLIFIKYYYHFVLGDEYADAQILSMIIISGIGIYFLGVISYFSAVFHKDGTVKTPAITNIITTSIIAIYMFVSVIAGGEYALMLCAASYPLREFLNLIVIKVIEWRR
jgi:O-antigen/teichoic acid export membrane protein